MTATSARISKRSASRAENGGRADFHLDSHIFFWFGQILGRRNRVLNRELRPFGLDCQRWRVLAALSDHSGCTMRRLAELTAVDRTTLNHTLRLMIESGLVRREPGITDKRSVAIWLTPAGRHRLRQILPVVKDLNARCAQGLTAADLRGLVAQLRRMTGNLPVDPQPKA